MNGKLVFNLHEHDIVTNARRGHALALAGSVLAMSLLHHLIPLEYLHWHNVVQHLYYLPIALAGLMFGWRGGAAIAALAAVTHLPHILLAWSIAPFYASDQLSEIALFVVAGAFIGALAERERRQRIRLEETTHELDLAYQELQSNFEQMKRAERLYAVGQLSAGLAHEIRNPLAGITGAVALLKKKGQPEPRRSECLEIVDRECLRLNRLLTSFLDFARPRPPRFESTSVAHLIDSVVDLARHMSRDERVAIRSESTAGEATVDSDPDQMRQVLLNLVMNAIQSMSEGGEVVIFVDAEGESLRISVRDQGKGVAPELRDRIFDPFFTTRDAGTGLGLSVAHQIVEQHGGTITAEANPDRGMTFRVTLPARQAVLL